MAGGAATPPGRPWWRRLAWVPGLFLFLALIAVVTHLGEEKRLLLLVRRSQPAWLAAAAILQGAYFCAAGVWRRVLRQAGVRLPLAELAPLAVARLFTDQVLPRAPRRLVRDRAVLLRCTVLQLAIFLLDSSTLWVMLRAVGWPIGPVEVFASFLIASVAMTVFPTPGGLGTFETACVTMLTLLRVPVEAALAATLLLRGVHLLAADAPWLLAVPARAPREEGPLPRRRLRVAGRLFKLESPDLRLAQGVSK